MQKFNINEFHSSFFLDQFLFHMPPLTNSSLLELHIEIDIEDASRFIKKECDMFWLWEGESRDTCATYLLFLQLGMKKYMGLWKLFSLDK